MLVHEYQIHLLFAADSVLQKFLVVLEESLAKFCVYETFEAFMVQ